MNEEKLYQQACKIKFLSYEIESLAKILNSFLFQGSEFVAQNDLVILSNILKQKTITVSKMCQKHTYQIEQIY